MKSYPIKFEPILQEKIWGGSKLKSVLNKKCTSDGIGESWEISGVQGNISKVSNGTYKGQTIVELLEKHTSQFVGAENYTRFGNEFPLLIKFLDAKTNLSVQVHPDDSMALKEHNSYGKTEMWYIMDHDEDAEIILGFKDDKTAPSVLTDVNESNVYNIFNTETVAKGDSYFIPAGQIHAIGAGVLAAEIQQTSDITYRVYDWDRTDNYGNKRALHLDQSIAATKNTITDFKKTTSTLSNSNPNVVSCEYFKTNIIEVKDTFKKQYKNLDSFVIFICVEGESTITVDGHEETLKTGETVLIPAKSEKITFQSTNAKMLEVYIS